MSEHEQRQQQSITITGSDEQQERAYPYHLDPEDSMTIGQLAEVLDISISEERFNELSDELKLHFRRAD